MIFEKIRERLQKKSFVDYEECYTDNGECLISISEAIDIINQVEAEYKEEYKSKCADCTRRKFYMMGYQAAKENNGWIPCSERLPETNDAVNVVWVNRKPEPYYADIKDKPFTATGHYHKGKWYWYSVVCKDYLDEYGTSDVDEVDEDIDIIAWQPLPQPPKGE